MFKHIKKFQETFGAKEDEYLGNIWGWKVSFIGLGLISFLLALYFYRVIYYQPDIPNEKDKIEQQIIPN